MRSSLTCPLSALGRPTGFVFFSSMAPHRYQSDHVDLLLELAGQLAMAVEKARLYQDLMDANRRIEDRNTLLAQLAMLDPLTEILNRRGFDERLDHEWRRACRQQTPLALALVDLDGFKLYNDRYGHIEGDLCLRSAAQRLKGYVKRANDALARYGGDEFAVILSNADLPAAVSFAEHLREAIETLPLATGGSLSASIGVSGLVPSGDLSPWQLIQTADRALYQAKKSGRNQVCDLSMDATPPSPAA